jgi:hypothetical protein
VPVTCGIGSISPALRPEKPGYNAGMAEIFGTAGEPVAVSGQYECSQCGFRRHFTAGENFPADHHPEKPWTLYLTD